MGESYTARYRALTGARAQEAYELRVRAFGVRALVAPYRGFRPVVIPRQRRPIRTFLSRVADKVGPVS